MHGNLKELEIALQDGMDFTWTLMMDERVDGWYRWWVIQEQLDACGRATEEVGPFPTFVEVQAAAITFLRQGGKEGMAQQLEKKFRRLGA